MKSKWIIFGSYFGGAKEEIDSGEGELEGLRVLNEYRIAYGCEWSLYIKTI